MTLRRVRRLCWGKRLSREDTVDFYTQNDRFSPGDYPPVPRILASGASLMYQFLLGL
jgi:hypothetical protein